MVSGYDVESAILLHPEVQLVAAFGVPSELTDEDLMISVVRQPGSQLAELELLDWCKANISPVLVPRYIELVDELPMTSTGKIEKYKLRNRGATVTAFDARRDPKN